MPKVLVVKVDTPKKVYPNISFKIKWKEWFFVWPFKEYKLFSRISRDDKIIMEYHYKIKHTWFWGNRSHLIIDSGLIKDTKFKIEVGYED